MKKEENLEKTLKIDVDLENDLEIQNSSPSLKKFSPAALQENGSKF